MANNDPPLLVVKNLFTQFVSARAPVTVVDHLSFELPKGQTIALVGESGCGKTVSALSLLRILPSPQALSPKGEVLFEGKNLLTISEKEMRKVRGGRIAMIFQNPLSSLNPVFTIGEQLLETAYFHLNIEEEQAYLEVCRALEEVHLEPPIVMSKYPHQLSGGMLQRVMIAMALIGKPALLIADEPTTALDRTIAYQILDLLKEIQKKREMSLLVITHDIDVVFAIAERVIVMYAGQAIEEGPVSIVLKTPAHPYTKALLGARPSHHLREGPLTALTGHVPPPTELPSGCRFHPRCNQAFSACKTTPPQLIELKTKNHQVRCLLFNECLPSKKDFYGTTS